jgi:hypothetical protein
MAVPDSGRMRSSTAGLTLLALGVVFGDIGTSPLYTVQTCFSNFTGLKPTPDNVLGILSLVFLGGCGVGLILGIIAWVMGNGDLRLIVHKTASSLMLSHLGASPLILLTPYAVKALETLRAGCRASIVTAATAITLLPITCVVCWSYRQAKRSGSRKRFGNS